MHVTLHALYSSLHRSLHRSRNSLYSNDNDNLSIFRVINTQSQLVFSDLFQQFSMRHMLLERDSVR